MVAAHSASLEVIGLQAFFIAKQKKSRHASSPSIIRTNSSMAGVGPLRPRRKRLQQNVLRANAR